MADEHTASAVPNAAPGSSQNSEAAANKKFLDADELAAKVSDAMFLRNLSAKLQKEAKQRESAASKRIFKSKEEYLQNAREDAYAAEGDRIADAKQKRIEGIENARMYSARRAQEEEQIMAEEVKFEKGDFNATDKQRAFLSKIYDRLHPYHKAHIDKEMLDGCARDEYKLSSKMVNEAIATSTALNFLKYHMVPEDLEKLTVQEALSKQKDFENKPNLKMIANMKAAGIKYDENTTFEQAKELLNNRPITDRQFELLRNRIDGAEKLTCGEARQVMDKLQRDYKESLKQPVSEAIRKVAIENKLIKEGQAYTNAEWKKDAMRMEPTPSMKAQLSYYAITLSEEHNNLFSAQRAVENTIRRFEENQHSPITEAQQSYLLKAGYVQEDSRYNDGSRLLIPATYGQAQEAIWDAKYTAGLIGRSDAKYLITHPDIRLPENFLDAKQHRLDLPDAERDAIRKETHDLVVTDKQARRLTAILSQDAVPREQSMLQDVARIAAYDHYDRDKGVIKDTAVKDMAKQLLSLNVEPTKYQLSSLLLLQDKNGNNIEPTKNQYLAHVIACTLPQDAADYKGSVAKNLEVVNKVEKAMLTAQKNLEKKAQIEKEVAASKAKTQSQHKGQGMGE
jgi:hypothetical protein|nr:MAG TPA: hypothetical protein [Caudoviricetes sp.]